MSSEGIVNAADIKRLLRKDPLFGEIYEKYGAPPAWFREPGFISLSMIILEQQVSLASAKAHFQKLHGYIGEFTPANILRLTDEEMRNCQISRQKAKYLRALSEAITLDALDLHRLGVLGEEAIREKLTGIKGIGRWTSDIYLMFCLQAKDVFPIGDIAVVNTIKELSDARTQEEILALSQRWKPLRSLATYFLWHNYLSRRGRS
jgi:DNA-3-methyladenine glycosylase II